MFVWPIHVLLSLYRLDINKELEEIDKKGTSGKVKDVKNKNLFEAKPISTKGV